MSNDYSLDICVTGNYDLVIIYLDGIAVSQYPDSLAEIVGRNGILLLLEWH